MDSKTQNLDLFDLISERHLYLRKVAESEWNNSSEIYLSNSEWFILARIYQLKETTISYITKQVDISRQATHKFIRNLKKKGFVEIIELEHNKKVKGIKLTELGKECYEKNQAIKLELEKRIAKKIGKEQLEQLKELLTLEWGL